MNSLRSKIYIGFAAVVSLVVAIGLIGYIGAAQLQDSTIEMRRISDVNSQVLKIDRDVQELQLRVGRYVASGHVALRDDIVELNNDLIRAIREAEESQTDPEMRDLFERMSQQLPEYKTHFDSVIEERLIRADLVQSQLPRQARQIQTLLDRLRSRTAETASAENRLALLHCEAMFAQGEQSLLRYYVAPDFAHAANATKNLEAARASLDDMDLSNDVAPLRAELAAELKEYQRIGIRAVQATRSYLHLVNVVMAGEASEVAWFSQKLKQSSGEQRDRISDKVAATTRNVQRWTGMGIGITLVLTLLIAGRLAMLILRPITELTGTFQQLAAGETLVTVPGTQRKDEIGQMAKAAEVFSDRNRKNREMLEQSERLTEELRATNDDLDSFAYVASHDLKSPLRGIQQLTNWIEEDSGHLLPEKSLKHVRSLQTRVARMELLLNDLLNFSRVGRIKTEREHVQLEQLLQGIVELTDNPDKVKIEWQQPLPNLDTLRMPLEQALLNLIGNAIKHNDKGAQGVVRVTCDEHPDHYVFQVRDNGPGIEPQYHERVFKMYQRLGNTKAEGTGMGLAIVKKQIETIGGKIDIVTNPDAGVTFSFTWPTSIAG